MNRNKCLQLGKIAVPWFYQNLDNNYDSFYSMLIIANSRNKKNMWNVVDIYNKLNSSY